jgi:hypothetical protein
MEIANIYDNGPISPVAKIKDNLSIFTEKNDWDHYLIDYIEPIPMSSPFQVEMITANGFTQMAANGSMQKAVVQILQMNSNELLHLRWYPIDDVHGLLWQLSGQARFSSRGAHAHVTQATSTFDPYLATTTFWVLGGEVSKDMNLEVRNPNPVVISQARFAFFGYRYVLRKLASMPAHTTYLPAVGR